VRNSLERWEPRIEVLEVAVTHDPDRPGLLFVAIAYAARQTNDRRNLVFPFYVIPEEGED
jgi:phage baseplate assembly protein W